MEMASASYAELAARVLEKCFGAAKTPSLKGLTGRRVMMPLLARVPSVSEHVSTGPAVTPPTEIEGQVLALCPSPPLTCRVSGNTHY